MIRIKFFKYIMIAILGWMAFCGVEAQKIIIYSEVPDSVKLPPFRESFRVLAKNRAIYNQYNDSIFLIKDHDKWVNFFRRRALKNHQIFASNKVMLSNIFDYFERDTVYFEAYKQLFAYYFDDYRKRASTDPFLTLKVCQVLDGCNRLAPDSLTNANIINVWLGEACYQLFYLGNDTSMLKQSSLYYKKVLKEEASRISNYKWAYPVTLGRLLSNSYLLNNCLTIQEHNDYFAKLGKWYEEYKNDSILGKNTISWIRTLLRGHDESLLRNVYMADTTVMDKQVADSLMRAIVKRNLSNDKLSFLSFARTLIMQERLGLVSASQAVKLYLDRYGMYWKAIRKQRLNAKEIADYLAPFSSLFYLNDISDMSYSKKRSIVKRMCRDIELAYQHRKDQQVSNAYIKSLNTFTTYPRLTKYLTPDERIRFLNSLNVATQVTTYAHSVHVSMIAEVLMEGVVKYQPKLLEGTLGYEFVQDVVKNKKVFVNFAHDAAMYHDLGKNSIISVVNNDYRPLTDEEFAIIKRHPELGLQYLALSPKLAKFHDTTLGHHKWYNGKGGYPSNFDNTKSPMRIMIDIVTLSDCMQAATERVGRNYKGDKTFDTVMGEFRHDAGVRYNPNLVKLIDAHPDLAKKLSDLINEGWEDIYYNIYSGFMAK